MSYPINYPTPQGCNVQLFYGRNKGDSTNAPPQSFCWVKPKGASFVWFTLIGGGGGGTLVDSGGGSGAVTNCLMPAFLVPDQLRIRTDTSSSIFVTYQGQNLAAGYDLLTATGGGIGDSVTAGVGAPASARTPFAAAGLYQSIAGQNGEISSDVSASPTTFLGGGGGRSLDPVIPNYGYPQALQGYFQMSPIIVGKGGSVNNSDVGQTGGIGCGGGGGQAVGGKGGQSMAVIISW